MKNKNLQIESGRRFPAGQDLELRQLRQKSRMIVITSIEYGWFCGYLYPRPYLRATGGAQGVGLGRVPHSKETQSKAGRKSNMAPQRRGGLKM